MDDNHDHVNKNLNDRLNNIDPLLILDPQVDNLGQDNPFEDLFLNNLCGHRYIGT